MVGTANIVLSMEIWASTVNTFLSIWLYCIHGYRLSIEFMYVKSKVIWVCTCTSYGSLKKKKTLHRDYTHIFLTSSRDRWIYISGSKSHLGGSGEFLELLFCVRAVSALMQGMQKQLETGGCSIEALVNEPWGCLRSNLWILVFIDNST